MNEKDSKIKKMYNNITPPFGSSERFADRVIEKAQQRRIRRANRYMSPAFAAGVAAIMIMAAAAFFLNGGLQEVTPPVGDPISPSSSQAHTTAADESAEKSKSEPHKHINGVGNWEDFKHLAVKPAWSVLTRTPAAEVEEDYEDNNDIDFNVIGVINDGHGQALVAIELTAVNGFTFTVGEVYEFAVWFSDSYEFHNPGYTFKADNKNSVVILFYMPTHYTTFNIFAIDSYATFKIDANVTALPSRVYDFALTTPARLSNEQSEFQPLKMTVTPISMIVEYYSKTENGLIYDDFFIYAHEEQLFGIEFSVGSVRYSLSNSPPRRFNGTEWRTKSFNVCVGTRGTETNTDMVMFTKPLDFDELESIYLSGSDLMWKEANTEHETRRFARVMELSREEKAMYEIVQESDSEATLITLDSKVNRDGTVTMTAVRGVSHDFKGVMLFGEPAVFPDGGLHWNDSTVLGYRCIFDGELYYYPEAVRQLPKIKYTFSREADGEHKILSIKEDE